MISSAQEGHYRGCGLNTVNNVSVKHVQHEAYTSSMASGIVIAGPSPDDFVHLTFWREGLRLVEERFEQETRVIDGIEVARMKPLGNDSEHFREDVATVIIPVAKLEEICNALCQMRDNLARSLSARAQVMAADAAINASGEAGSHATGS